MPKRENPQTREPQSFLTQLETSRTWPEISTAHSKNMLTSSGRRVNVCAPHSFKNKPNHLPVPTLIWNQEEKMFSCVLPVFLHISFSRKTGSSFTDNYRVPPRAKPPKFFVDVEKLIIFQLFSLRASKKGNLKPLFCAVLFRPALKNTERRRSLERDVLYYFRGLLLPI